MAKSHPEATSAGAEARPMFEALQPEALIETCNRMLRHMEEINRAWVASLQDANGSGWDLAGRLARCSDPLDAGQMCAEWLNQRRDAAVSDGKRLSEMWLQLYGLELATAPARSLREAGASMQQRMAAAE